MSMNEIAKQDSQIKIATQKLENLGFKVERQGLRTKVYRQGLPASKWLEVRQLVGFMNFYLRRATPMQLAFLKVGIVGKR